MGLRIEQFDVQSVAKVFVTRLDLESNVREKLNAALNSSFISSEGIKIQSLTGEDGLLKNEFSLSPASSTTIGGIKLGKNLVMNDDFTVDAKGEEYTAGDGIILNKSSEPFVIEAKKATSTELGSIKLGENLLYNEETGCVDSKFTEYESGRGINIDNSHLSNDVKIIESNLASDTEYGVIKLGKGLLYNTDTGCVDTKTQDIIDASNDLIDSNGKIKIHSYSNGEGLSLSNGSDEKTKIFSLKHASTSNVGGVKVGSGLSIDNNGVLSVEQRKASSTDLGLIKVGENLNINIEGVLNADIGRSDILELERTIQSLKFENSLLFSEIERIYEIIGSTNIGISIHRYADNFISGSSLVDITLGTTIKFPTPVSNTDYIVNLTLSDKTSGAVGELWVEEKTTNGFTVKGSGAILKTRVDWVVFLDEEETTEFNSTSFPYIKGSTTVNSTDGTNVVFSSPMRSSDYAVIVTPLNSPEGTYGEVYIESKSESGFVIKSSGSFTGTVEYIVAEYGRGAYNKANHPIIGGSGTFNSLEPVQINIEEELTTNSYQVLLMPEGNHSGMLGEIWVSDKERTKFKVNTTGGTVSKFNYILIGS